MYYEQLQALGASYGLQKRAALQKRAMKPAKVIAALKKFESLRGSGYPFSGGGITPRINPVNGRLKGGLAGADIATAVKDSMPNGITAYGSGVGMANGALLNKQLPYLSKLLDARINLESLARGLSGGAPSQTAIKRINDVLQSNSPSMRKALLYKLDRSAVL